MALKLGEILIKHSLISRDQLDKALEHQRTNGGKLGSNLVQLGFVTEDDITRCLSKQFGVPSVNLSFFEIDGSVLELVPSEVCRKYDLIPVNKAGATLTVAMSDPTNIHAINDINFITGYSVEPVVAAETSIKEAIDKYYGSAHTVELQKTLEKVQEQMEVEDVGDVQVLEETEELDLSDLTKAVEEAPVVKLVNKIIFDACIRGASDIHVEPYEKEFRIRYRIDGVLYIVLNPPIKLKDAITSRIKIMSRMDIAEKRLPQDGRIKVKLKIQDRIKELDFRVSVIPCLFGEKVVMRLLDKDRLMLDMTKLGFETESLNKFEVAIEKPYGMILVTGPTGSGKTNTLYSAIQKINRPEVNIVTCEDPVEFNIPGVNQVMMHDQIGLNFSAALRSFLRQDPNIILVGEVRDFETAEIAIKAALTGHLVLSTLHTNDAPSAITRLMNMGIEPFLVASSIHLIVAQRLIRKVCANCKEPIKVAPQALMEIGFSEEDARNITIYKGRGCQQCHSSGYKGRIALYEVLEVNDEVKELVLVGASALEIRRKALENGMVTLRQSGLEKIRHGVTSIEEVVRETLSN
ncbi:MAG: type IV-A pilus assembly ATPase PilB [Candidatus Fischerbacteria bacterium RBG_13_37_8]|uniref:Type IV-A pilus assembly ATPase PilB n=1 Tax=Candidatus Fischerbacteria bacterium RBG_13_37_8 TaxID=1817863 RepID=A0A1F5V6K3_9BACT|nr:MAG: type IV-A pilus assembly ATPase PilB [Candidatus Fischerbacteria bacterium RBG_13_37_8]